MNTISWLEVCRHEPFRSTSPSFGAHFAQPGHACHSPASSLTWCCSQAQPRTLSGIGAALAHTIASRSHQPSARSASASSHGAPIRSLGFRPAVAIDRSR